MGGAAPMATGLHAAGAKAFRASTAGMGSAMVVGGTAGAMAWRASMH